MKIKKQLTIILLLFVVLFSCKKDNNNAHEEDNIIGKNVSATVIYTGELASDGCGWLIRIDSTKFYHPTNLSDGFKKNNLPVIINYHLLNTKYQCSTNPNNVLTGMNIDAIRNK